MINLPSVLNTAQVKFIRDSFVPTTYNEYRRFFKALRDEYGYELPFALNCKKVLMSDLYTQLSDDVRDEHYNEPSVPIITGIEKAQGHWYNIILDYSDVIAVNSAASCRKVLSLQNIYIKLPTTPFTTVTISHEQYQNRNSTRPIIQEENLPSSGTDKDNHSKAERRRDTINSSSIIQAMERRTAEVEEGFRNIEESIDRVQQAGEQCMLAAFGAGRLTSGLRSASTNSIEPTTIEVEAIDVVADAQSQIALPNNISDDDLAADMAGDIAEYMVDEDIREADEAAARGAFDTDYDEDEDEEEEEEPNDEQLADIEEEMSDEELNSLPF